MGEIGSYGWLLIVLVLMVIALLKFVSKLLAPILPILRDSKGKLNPDAPLEKMDLTPTKIIIKFGHRGSTKQTEDN